MVSTETIQCDEQLQHCLFTSYIHKGTPVVHTPIRFESMEWDTGIVSTLDLDQLKRPVSHCCSTFYLLLLQTAHPRITHSEQFFTQITSQICAYEEGTTTN